MNGVRDAVAAAGSAASFVADITDSQRVAFNAATPNRIAVKHAHSQRNPEKDWGRDTLRAVEFAFYVLNEQYGDALPSGKKARVITPAGAHRHRLVGLQRRRRGAGGGRGRQVRADRRRRGHRAEHPDPAAGHADDPARQPDLHRRRRSRCTTTSASPMSTSRAHRSRRRCRPRACRSTRSSPANAANRCTTLAELGLVSGSTTAERADRRDEPPARLRLGAGDRGAAAVALHARHGVDRDDLCERARALLGARQPVRAELRVHRCDGGQPNLAPGDCGPGGDRDDLQHGQRRAARPRGINIVNNNPLGGPLLDASRRSSPATRGSADYGSDAALCQRAL